MATEPQPIPDIVFSPERQPVQERVWKERLKSSHTALLVVDMQNDFLSPNGFFAQRLKQPIAQMQSTVPYIKGLIDRAHAAGVLVIYTQGYEDVKFRDPDGPDGLRAIEWDEHDGDGSINSESGTWGSGFYQGLEPQADDIIVEKHKWSAFDGKDKAEQDMGKKKDLQTILKEKGISTLVVAGVVAETCIETTVRDAYSKGYTIFIPEHSIGSNDDLQLKARMGYFSKGFISRVIDEEKLKEYWPAPKPSEIVPKEGAFSSRGV